ncbi:MAG: MarR family transcriptional regulator [Proteobacteria bacterium]|nr:MarR family transcriptional regulator [Pseudomonadota bacterium]
MRTISPAVKSWVYVLRLSTIVTRRADQELREQGLTLARFDVIAQLGAQEGCCTQESLCSRLLVTKGHVSILLDRMVREGLVARAQDPENRRCNRVALTPKGRRLYEKAVPRHERCLESLFDPLTRREQAQMEGLLLKLLRGVRVKLRCDAAGECI